MKRQDVKDAMSLASRLWPQAGWDREVQAELARRMLSLPIDAAQAKASLMELCFECKYHRIQPAEVWAALLRAAGRVSGTGTNLSPASHELIELRALQASGQFAHLAREWLSIQGSKFSHWEPAWLAATNEPSKWFWGRRFLAWARGRWSLSHGSQQERTRPNGEDFAGTGRQVALNYL